jgi:hypothetical protein
MPSFHIPQIKSYLPTLKECYGFDTIEIANELAKVIEPFLDPRKIDEIAWEQCKNGKGKIVLLDYAMNTNENIDICTTDDFDKHIKDIHDLCEKYIDNEKMLDEAKFIFVFMSAIFNRDSNGLNNDNIIKSYLEDFNGLRHDLLKLYIALNKPQHEHDTPLKIRFNTDNHSHTINNHKGWLSDMLNEFVGAMLKDITVEKAEQELKEKYSDVRGRKSSNPHLNYIINGTYNFITKFLDSDKGKVTVKQSEFLQKYLIIIGQIKNGDTLTNLNTLQSNVTSLLTSGLTPVAKHVKETSLT